MELKLRRVARRNTYTIGKLYIDDKLVCDVLEDTDRGLKSTMSLSEITKMKVYGKTAIPAGTYVIRMDMPSPKYREKAKRDAFWKPYCENMPRLEGVKGYNGILIHAGTDDKDTLGCLLVGVNSVIGKLTSSRATFKKVFDILFAAHNRGEKITIEIV